MKQVTHFVAMANARSCDAHESFVQAQCSVETETVEKSCGISNRMESGPIYDAFDKHCVGQ